VPNIFSPAFFLNSLSYIRLVTVVSSWHVSEPTAEM
jgi:hypothetical protein